MICTSAKIRTDTGVDSIRKQGFSYFDSLEKILIRDKGEILNSLNAHPFLWWCTQALIPVQPLQSNDESSCASGFTCFPSTHDVGRDIWINPLKVRCHTYVGLEWVEWKEGMGLSDKK